MMRAATGRISTLGPELSAARPALASPTVAASTGSPPEARLV
jgi:hypothetical protein